MINIRKTPFTFIIHMALAIIIAGALVTHFSGIQGSVTLRQGETATRQFNHTSGPGDGSFPFDISLAGCEVICYPGTETPMDYRSTLAISDTTLTVAMNSVAEYDGWRFYQTGMGPDSSTLSICHDPWGIGITYAGYILLGIGMIGFFFQRHTLWRALLPIAILFIPIVCQASPRTIQRPLAHNFGKIYVYWNDRISPLQTMALDVTAKLYGSTSYQGLTAEQVLAGWLFYYDEWLDDYNNSTPTPRNKKEQKKDDERRALMQWLGTGAAFRIFPYHAADGSVVWLSLTGQRPSQMSMQQWQFMRTAIADIGADISMGHNIAANDKITLLIGNQELYAGKDILPSGTRFNAERFYNSHIHLFPAAGCLMLSAIVMLWLSLANPAKSYRSIRIIPIIAALYLALVLVLRGIVGGHIPLSNGSETMLFMAFAACVSATVIRGNLMMAALTLVGAMALMVAAMAGKTPQIAALMPVLHSPLLSIHVMLVMCSYVMFLFMAILAAVGLVKKSLRKHMARINAICLVPAVFMLAAGIFIGAVWANQSWGRYWGWDPKETCALITLLIYAAPLHRISLRLFRNPKYLNIYLLIAILSVIFTYFGANYLLPGLHSYA